MSIDSFGRDESIRYYRFNEDTRLWQFWADGIWWNSNYRDKGEIGLEEESIEFLEYKDTKDEKEIMYNENREDRFSIFYRYNPVKEIWQFFEDKPSIHQWVGSRMFSPNKTEEYIKSNWLGLDFKCIIISYKDTWAEDEED